MFAETLIFISSYRTTSGKHSPLLQPKSPKKWKPLTWRAKGSGKPMAITCCSSCCCMAGGTAGTAGLRWRDLKILSEWNNLKQLLKQETSGFHQQKWIGWGVHQQKMGFFLTNNNESGWRTSNKLGLKQQTVGIICTRNLQSSSAKVLDWHGWSCTSRNLPGLPVAYWTLPTASRQLCIFVVSKDLHNHQNTVVLQLGFV